MQATFSLFPWDVDGDPEAARWLAARGVRRVALAATYHAARAATPRHPRHRIVNIDASASYLADPAPLPRGTASFDRARDDLETAGVTVDAWVVLGHVDHSRPDIPRVVDAFGTELPHAICLRSPEALEYVDATLDAVQRAGSAGLVVEGASWSGAGHASMHDKVSAAGLDLEALSWCFCGRCCEVASVDPAEVRASLTRHRPVDPALAEGIRRSRREAAAHVRARVLDKARRAGIRRVIFHPDPDSETAVAGDTLADAWGGAADALRQLMDGSAHGAYVTILSDPRPTASQLRAAWSMLAAAGSRELLVYHAGLASTPRLTAALTALKGIA